MCPKGANQQLAGDMDDSQHRGGSSRIDVVTAVIFSAHPTTVSNCRRFCESKVYICKRKSGTWNTFSHCMLGEVQVLARYSVLTFQMSVAGRMSA